MRPHAFGLLIGAALLACDDGVDLVPLETAWMEWPAEVAAATPFGVRIVGVTSDPASLKVVITQDGSGVTLEPYVRPSTCRGFCPPRALGEFDTLVVVGGLTASAPRTYEIRGLARVDTARVARVTRFGELMARPSAPGTGRAHAGGPASVFRDEFSNCYRLGTGALFPFYVLENPPDSAPGWTAFVRGYVDSTAASPCSFPGGFVFHLISRN